MAVSKMHSIMNIFNKPRIVGIVVLTIVLFVLLGFALRKPVLIAYHRNMMIHTWQKHVGLPRPTGSLESQLKGYGLAPPPAKPFADPNAMQRVFGHRSALVNLGYFTQRRFAISPLSVDDEKYKQLGVRVAELTGQQPTAQWDYDDPASPTKVLGLTVFSIPEEMSQWAVFAAALAKNHD